MHTKKQIAIYQQNPVAATVAAEKNCGVERPNCGKITSVPW
jgi:hypothetical protein